MMTIVTFKPKTRDDFLEDVVKQLVELRHHRKLSQAELDHIIGVADRLVSKWECGMRTPTAFNLYCWVEALGGELMVIDRRDRPPNTKGGFGVIKDDKIVRYKPVNNNERLKTAS